MSDYITVPLGSKKHPGKVAIVDASEAHRVAKHHWMYHTSHNNEYAIAWLKVDGRAHCLHLHRFIMGAPDGVEIDHIDGDGLRCTFDNMRYASSAQNRKNLRKNVVSDTAPYKGVYCRKDMDGRWQASISVDGKRKYLGMFATAKDAARAYDEAARQYHGDFAKLNFPDEPTTVLMSDPERGRPFRLTTVNRRGKNGSYERDWSDSRRYARAATIIIVARGMRDAMDGAEHQNEGPYPVGTEVWREDKHGLALVSRYGISGEVLDNWPA